MTNYDPLDAEADCFHPPAIPTLVGCLHCGEEYESYLIEWRVRTNHEGKPHGSWCCPTPNCGGCGFGFDILPCDRDYRDENGELMWCSTDDEDDDWEFEDEMIDDYRDEPAADQKENLGDDSFPF